MHTGRRQMVGARVVTGGRESVLHGDTVSVWGDGKFWRRKVGVAGGQCEWAS